MLTATVLLSLIGLFGAFDIAYFHTLKGRLVERDECRREAWLHVARGFVYAAQFLVVPNLRLTGAWYLAFVALYLVDVAVGVSDIVEEPRSRAKQGGLSGGEYLMHMFLSVLVGAQLCALGANTLGWWNEPTALAIEPHAPDWLRALLAVMAVGAVVVALVEALVLLEPTLSAPKPIHVRIRLPATLAEVWETTQDHRLHPTWDHRFSRIELLDETIRSGTLMRYEKSIGGVVIRGFGRYKLHRPMRQSTFEFWSDDARSLIRRGVGLWLYTPLPTGEVEFATSYTYEVRWGTFGRVVDRWLFQPAFQRYTEQSFRRLARRYFGVRRPRVLGSDGRRPAQFASAMAR